MPTRKGKQFKGDYIALWNSQEISDVLYAIGQKDEECYALMVKVGEGEYKEVWGCYDRRPYINEAVFYDLMVRGNKLSSVTILGTHDNPAVWFLRHESRKVYRNVSRSSLDRLLRVANRLSQASEVTVQLKAFGWILYTI